MKVKEQADGTLIDLESGHEVVMLVVFGAVTVGDDWEQASDPATARYRAILHEAARSFGIDAAIAIADGDWEMLSPADRRPKAEFKAWLGREVLAWIKAGFTVRLAQAEPALAKLVQLAGESSCAYARSVIGFVALVEESRLTPPKGTEGELRRIRDRLWSLAESGPPTAKIAALRVLHGLADEGSEAVDWGAAIEQIEACSQPERARLRGKVCELEGRRSTAAQRLVGRIALLDVDPPVADELASRWRRPPPRPISSNAPLETVSLRSSMTLARSRPSSEAGSPARRLVRRRAERESTNTDRSTRVELGSWWIGRVPWSARFAFAPTAAH